MASLLLFTLLCVSITIPSLAESTHIRIDCGASVVSDNSEWVGDKDFVTTGTSYEIRAKDDLPVPLNTYRYFPSGGKNCYRNIPAKKGGKTLVRTQFVYLNNVKKSSFNVFYDDKHLVNVVLPDPDAKQSLFKSEVIFSPTSEKISVCLLRTSGGGDPFISSIEVYNLYAGMYDDDGLSSDEGLILLNRFAFAANKFTSYPFPLDPYGRQWDPYPYNNPNFDKLKTLASSIDITDASNKPPETVMSNALSSPDLKFNIGLSLTGGRVYLALYFSEPRSLKQTQKRSFNVFLDDKQINSVPIVPVFGKVIQVIEKNVMATATSKSQVTFKETEDSNLPPLINAFEIYSIRKRWTKEMPEPDLGEKPPMDRLFKPDDIQNAKEVLSREKLNWKKIKLPVIISTTSGTAVVLAAFVFWKKSSKAKPHESNTLPTTSTGHETVSGESPLIGQQLKSDAKPQESNEPGKV